jgi:hypothetical protein
LLAEDVDCVAEVFACESEVDSHVLGKTDPFHVWPSSCYPEPRFLISERNLIMNVTASIGRWYK